MDATEQGESVQVEVIPHRHVKCPHCDQLYSAVVLNNRADGASMMFTSPDPEATDLMEALGTGELVEWMRERMEQEEGKGDAVPESITSA